MSSKRQPSVGTRFGLMILDKLNDHGKRIGELEEVSRVTREINQATMRKLSLWLKVLGVIVGLVTILGEGLRVFATVRDLAKH